MRGKRARAIRKLAGNSMTVLSVTGRVYNKKKYRQLKKAYNRGEWRTLYDLGMASELVDASVPDTFGPED